MMLYVLVSTILCLVPVLAVDLCPNQWDIRPCTCKTSQISGLYFAVLTCEGLDSEDILRDVLQAVRGFSVAELDILHANFSYLHHNAFEGTNIKLLSFRNSSLRSLSDAGLAFVGLEDHLEILEVSNCSYVAEWDWQQISGLRFLKHITVVGAGLTNITAELSAVQNIDVKDFGFERNCIEVIPDTAFASFANSEKITLDNNLISILKRTMFPSPANELGIIGLSNNKIQWLPSDMFSNMPVLNNIYLSGNPIVTISEDVFRPIWDQLRLFLFYATPLYCDQRIAWVTELDNRRKYLRAECMYPDNLKGRLLASLNRDELVC